VSPSVATSPTETVNTARSAVEVNPYAASVVAEPLVPSVDILGVGAWRDGDYLVMHQQATLPKICLFTGRPATRQRVVKLEWEHRFLSSKRLRLASPLCDRWVWADRIHLWTGLAAGSAAVVGAATMIQNGGSGQWLLPAIVRSAIVAIYTQFKEQGCGVAKARGDYLWIAVAGRDFLAQLPPWPEGD
jgi:hypothetical protein